MTTKKKTAQNIKKKEKTMEKQVENLEKFVDKIKEIDDKKQKQAKIEKERKKKIDEKVDSIREDLKNQLFTQNKFGKQFDDMVEDYIFFVRLKEDLQNDIRDKGLRYEVRTGNGYVTEKPNESVKNLKDINAQMLKILQDLDLKAPEEGPKAGEGDDLL